MSSITLSVIIVAYKNFEIVIDCLESIARFNDIGAQLEVIVVDNSPNAEVARAIDSRFPSVTTLPNKNNGFGEGNNAGAKIARGDFFLFLNPDTILVEPIFSFALKKFSENPKLSLFGVKLIDRNLQRNFSFYLLNGGGFLRSMFIKLANRLDLYIDGLMYIAGADMFVRRTDFFASGGFDEKIFMYYEEPDLTRRLRALGKKTGYFNDRKIIHLEGGTTADSELALRRRLDSAIYYCKKYSLNAESMLRRELRYERFKAFLSRINLVSREKQANAKIRVLSEYLASLQAKIAHSTELRSPSYPNEP
jgi:GT2 family glycosyltransferase